ncbi:MAG: hypothetical protein IK123_03830, partial [Lachnospiraceae bacterium]|nr:hypothetical protein [Lachnospiraceae bacterium]
MKVKIEPTNTNNTETVFIQAPPSKSIAHRMLICAALSDGVSTISGLELSEDIRATIDCLKTLGAKIELNEGTKDDTNVCKLCTATVNPIPGIGLQDEDDLSDKPSFDEQIIKLNCNESGSTLRFMIPVSTLLFDRNILKDNQTVRFTGAGRLLSRPLDVYDTLFKYTFVNFTHNPDCVDVTGHLQAGDYRIEGNVSSQFITGLLLTLPAIPGNSRIHIIPPVESRPYI